MVSYCVYFFAMWVLSYCCGFYVRMHISLYTFHMFCEGALIYVLIVLSALGNMR